MTPKNGSPEASMGDTVAHQLRALGTRGVLVQLAQRGQIIELRCEMPKCYCHKGRGYFAPRSTPLTDRARSPDHYPRLKADRGLLPGVRWSETSCYGSRRSERFDLDRSEGRYAGGTRRELGTRRRLPHADGQTRSSEHS
jgi:hypothetical protein